MRVAVAANSAWYLWNFRRRLMQRLRDDGHEAIAVSPADAYAPRITDSGFRHLAWSLDASSTQPLKELASVLHLRRLLRQAGVEVLLSYTPKGNIYGGLAAWGTPMAFMPNVSGLGSGFVGQGPSAFLLRNLYRLTFARANHVLFQNPDDEQHFIEAGITNRDSCSRVPGSGVDLTRFRASPLPVRKRRTLLFVGRLLAEKGVRDLIAALKLLRASGHHVDARLLGPTDANNPSAITSAEVEQWVSEGLVAYLGNTDDVRIAIADADAVVLPSYYREGTPRSLLEASAMARPCITTDMPGCRSVVVPGLTGWLVKPRDPRDLACAITEFATVPADRLKVMGSAARARMECEFDETFVLDRYSTLLRNLTRQRP